MKKIKLLVSTLALASGSSFANYVNLMAPVGWNQGAGAASTFNFAKVAVGDVQVVGNTIRAAATLNTASRAVTLPVALRFAAGAGRAAAAASFGNPAVFLLLSSAAAYKWYSDNDVEVKDGVWKKRTTNSGINCVTDCYEYAFQSNSGTRVGQFTDLFTAMEQGGNYISGGAPHTNTLKGTHPDFTFDVLVGTYTFHLGFDRRQVPPYNTSEIHYDNLTRQQLEDHMASKPFAPAMPQNFPVPVDWPVEKPVFNPSPDAEPQPQPLRVPQGEPQVIPGTDPKQWRTPVVDIVPAPTATDPWRVDVQSKDIIKTDPAPLPDTASVPVTDTPGETTSPTTTPSDYCLENPELLACIKVGDTPQPDRMENKKEAVKVVAAAFSASSSCPSPIQISAFGRTYALSYDPVCERLAHIKYLIVLIGSVVAARILADSFKV